MAFQTEIELRVKVVDKELRDLEKRAEQIQRTNPFSASGGRVGVSQAQKQTAALKAQRAELLLIEKATKQQSVEQIKLLNKRTAWLKVLKEGKQISKDIAAATEKEAKAAAKVAAGEDIINSAKKYSEKTILENTKKFHQMMDDRKKNVEQKIIQMKENALKDIKKHRFLMHLSLVKQSRLSVMSIDSKSWKIICKMGKINP